MMERDDLLRRELAELQARIGQIEADLSRQHVRADWRPTEFYTIYYALAGAVLGLIGALASLLFNIVGALVVGKHPMELIRVYLTFPMGVDALTMESGLAIAIGCCLYLFTGVVLGIPYSLLINRYFAKSSFATRFVVTTLLSLGLWALNFYGLLSWLQPELFGGRWIVERIPWFVAAATHLVFGWTMLFMLPFGQLLGRTASETEKS